MKDVIKKIVWVLIFCGVLFAVYYFLPEYPHNYVQGFFQSKFDDMANMKITQVKSLTNKDVDNMSYEAILTGKTNTGCWIYIPVDKSDDGAEHVVYYGRNAAINLKDYPDYSGEMYTSAAIKVDFKISGGNVDITPYIDDFKRPLVILDGKHTKDNKKIKLDYFDQLVHGMKSEG